MARGGGRAGCVRERRFAMAGDLAMGARRGRRAGWRSLRDTAEGRLGLHEGEAGPDDDAPDDEVVRYTVGCGGACVGEDGNGDGDGDGCCGVRGMLDGERGVTSGEGM